MQYSIDLNDDDFVKILKSSWSAISRIRNKAIYRNFRFDVMKRPYVDKGVYPKELVKLKLDLLPEFNEALIRWVSQIILGILNEIKSLLGDDKMFFRCLDLVTNNPQVVD